VRSRQVLLLTGLVVALVAAVLVAAGSGQVSIDAGQVLSSVGRRMGLIGGGSPLTAQEENVLWFIRLPRVLLALAVGAALSYAGALMQGVFGNPLAEPGIIGVSAGAAVGAATAIVFGASAFGPWTVALAGFTGGCLTTILVYSMSRSAGRTEVVTLVLTGVAVNAGAGAIIGLLMFFADANTVQEIAFWNLGSMASATWPAVSVVLPCVLIGLLAGARYAHSLDLLALGERTASSLGVRVERMRVSLIIITALLTAAAVSFTGIVAFVGLVVPHAIRLIAGPGHRILLPASALGGALILVLGDLAARTMIEYQELPLGVLTALIGAPVFFLLLRRARSRAGGWG
jgi:iron complex transport system permease protein